MTANEIIQKAMTEVGITEYPPNSNNVKYNTEFYGKPVSGAAYPWCCTFVWWILSTSGVKVPKTASCMAMGDYFKKQGRFFTSDPRPGDLVFFHFKTNQRWTNHIGIVAEVKGNEITTIEGNTSLNSDDNGGAVMKRKRCSNIVGFGRPEYDNIERPKEPVKPILKRGDKGKYVKAWQEYLMSCNIDLGKYGADGDYGSYTERAVKLYQRLRGLPVTGIIDDDDWNSVGK